MADQTLPPVKKPARSIDPEQLATQYMLTLPGFDKAKLVTVMAAYAAMQNRTAEQALGMLGRRATPISKDGLAAAWLTANTQLGQTLEQTWKKFLDKTFEGERKNAPRISFEYFPERLDQELVQQDKRKQSADEIKTTCWKIVDGLDLRKTFMPPARRSVVDVDAVKERVSAIFYDSEKNTVKPVLNWLTPARIDRDEKTVQVVLDDVGSVLTDGFAGEEAFAEIKARLGYTRDQVISMLKDLIDRAEQQIAEADAIKNYVENDFNKNYRPIIEAVNSLNAILATVDTTFELSGLVAKLKMAQAAQPEAQQPPARGFQPKIRR